MKQCVFIIIKQKNQKKTSIISALHDLLKNIYYTIEPTNTSSFQISYFPLHDLHVSHYTQAT